MKTWPTWAFVAVCAGASACTEALPGDDRTDVGFAPDAVDESMMDAGTETADGSEDATTMLTDGSAPDATPDSGVTDTGGLPDASDSGVSFGKSTTRQSNGGGEATSPQYRLQLTIGGPSPVGTAASPSYRVIIGPNPAGN